MKVDIIAGARPNFMKIAPLIKEIETVQKQGINIYYRLIHTGQHYDKNMSASFFRDLEIPSPNINLEIGSGTQAEQTAGIMIGYEKAINQSAPDICIVVGDVNSTMACSVTAKKMGVKVAHIEAGIRSFDLSMPEEINRMVTDSITDFYFTTSHFANENLKNAGIPEDRIFFVGNIMIDTLLTNLHKFKKPLIWDQLNLQEAKYIILTLHRPANVDDGNKLIKMLDTIIKESRSLPIIFPVHPRTAKILKSYGSMDGIFFIDPLGYLEFNYLVKNCRLVITDSGGITEETTVMGIPCITIRDSTERPETVFTGTNELIGTNIEAIKPAMDVLFAGNWKKGSIPDLWDGKTAERIIKVLLSIEIL